MQEAVLVTGASRGIGRQFAEKYARQGNNLVVVARSEDDLKALKREVESEHGVEVLVVSMDLSEPDAAGELFERVSGEGVHVHTLVNNAGFANLGPFSENDSGREQDLLQLNMVTLTMLTRYFLDPMLEEGSGRILNVASTGAFVPGPFLGTYNASKAYILSFSEALAEELIDSNITVTCLCPGATTTGFMTEAGLDDQPFLTKVMNFIFMGEADPSNVADYGMRALEKGKVVAIHGWWNWFMFNLMSRMPRFVPRKMIGRIQGMAFRD